LEVVVAEAFAVHDGTIGEERSETVPHRADQVLMPTDVEVGLLLPGEGCIDRSSAVALERTAVGRLCPYFCDISS
jgi:hypothetical protein